MEWYEFITRRERKEQLQLLLEELNGAAKELVVVWWPGSDLGMNKCFLLS